MNLSLLGKNAFVGGASAGIGRAVAIELALLGANVSVVARTLEKLQATVALLDTSQGQKHDLLVADFSDSKSLVAAVEEKLKSQIFHILINNTGGPPAGKIVNARPSDFLAAYNNHLICNHLLAQAMLPGMKSAGFGRIVNIISTSVKEPLENLGVSNTTRWAVASWAKTLSVEVGQFGITVNNVLPGYTMTERLENIIEKTVEQQFADRDSVVEKMKIHVPLRRFAQAEEVAAAVAFLTSPAAAYINGVNLPVDGGRTKSL